MNIMLHGRTQRCIFNWDNVCAVSDYHDGDYNSLVTANDGKQTKVVETVDDIPAMVGYRVTQDGLVDLYHPQGVSVIHAGS